MTSILSDLSILLNAFGAGIGSFWTYLLFSRKKASTDHYLLASLLALFVIFMINTIIQLSGYGYWIKSYQKMANAITLLLGPLLLAYLFSHTRPDAQWKKNYWLHFLPFLLLSPFLFLDLAMASNKLLSRSLIYFWNLQMSIYLILGYRELKKCNAWGSLPAKIIRYFLPLWFLNLILLLIKLHWYPIPDLVFLNVTLLFALLIFMVALQTLKEMQLGKEQIKNFSLSENHYQDYSLLLQNLMESQRLYRNANLSIQELARWAKISPRYVSATLNHQMKQSFYEFVNGYRIKEVLEKLQGPEANTLTLLGIAQQAGFKSNSAFYKAFRQQTGMTPGAFRKNQGQ